MIDRPPAEPLDLAEAARLVNMTSAEAAHGLARGTFPRPAPRIGGEDVWFPSDLWAWAAKYRQEAAAAMPLSAWPLATEPGRPGAVREVPGAILQDWYLQNIPLRIVWPLPDEAPADLAAAAELGPSVPLVWRIDSGIGVYGPDLYAFVHGRRTSEPESWIDLVCALGLDRAPYWPLRLRSLEAIAEWTPGEAPRPRQAVPILDTSPIVELIETVSPDSAEAWTLRHFAQTIQADATSAAQGEVDMLVDEPEGELVDVAAVPGPSQDTIVEPDEGTERVGWLAIASRDDVIAAQVVRTKRAWDGGHMLPFCPPMKLRTHDAPPYQQAWADRLQPTARTAAFETLPLRDVPEPHQYLTDPETDAPVAVGGDGSVWTAPVQRLPAQTPLEAVILDDPIWVRTKDGTVYLAPQLPAAGLSWGYTGSGPGALALLIDRLLADINAPAVSDTRGGAGGIEDLVQQGWVPGTHLTRDHLKAARDGRPYAQQ